MILDPLDPAVGAPPQPPSPPRPPPLDSVSSPNLPSRGSSLSPVSPPSAPNLPSRGSSLDDAASSSPRAALLLGEEASSRRRVTFRRTVILPTVEDSEAASREEVLANGPLSLSVPRGASMWRMGMHALGWACARWDGQALADLTIPRFHVAQVATELAKEREHRLASRRPKRFPALGSPRRFPAPSSTRWPVVTVRGRSISAPAKGELSEPSGLGVQEAVKTVSAMSPTDPARRHLKGANDSIHVTLPGVHHDVALLGASNET